MKNFTKFALILIILNLKFDCYSQDLHGLGISQGGSANFTINTFDKYKNGQSLENYTVIRIFYQDVTIDAYNNWKLYFKASPSIVASSPLSLIKFKVEPALSTPGLTFTCCLVYTSIPNSYIQIVSNGPTGNYNQNYVVISWQYSPIWATTIDKTSGIFATGLDVLVTTDTNPPLK